MPGKSPETTAEQDGRMFLSIRGHVGGFNELSWFSPDVAFAIGSSDDVLLVVGHSEDSIACSSKEQNQSKLPGIQINWVSEKVMRLEVVHVRNIDNISHSVVPTEVVVGDVNGSEVPVFIVEEVDHICEVENIDKDHAISDISILLVLSCQERKVDKGPSNDSRSAIVEEFEVPELSDPGVHLNPHEEVVDDGA